MVIVSPPIRAKVFVIRKEHSRQVHTTNAVERRRTSERHGPAEAVVDGEGVERGGVKGQMSMAVT
jgi:hypothetical protein